MKLAAYVAASGTFCPRRLRMARHGDAATHHLGSSAGMISGAGVAGIAPDPQSCEVLGGQECKLGRQ
jgi:hypothetical protein